MIRSMGDRKPLRVHHLVDSLTFGGAELLMAELARVASRAGIELSVGYLLELADRSPGAERVRAAGVDPVCVGIPPRVWTSAMWRVRRHLAAVRPQLLHTHLPNSDLVGLPAARSLGIPAVSTIHAIEWGGDGLAGVRERLSAGARRRFASRVVAPSEGARRHYLDTGWDLPERVVTIYNGVHGEAQPGAGKRVRDELDLASDDLVVATLSKLRTEKAHDVAVAATGLLRERFPSMRLVIVGDGAERPALERAAAALGPSVRFAGYRADVMAVLDAVDVLVHPSRADAFPTTLLEAMAARVPVVATAVGGVPEIVEDGVTGILLEPPPRPEPLAAALADMLDDAGARERFGNAGRERFDARFTSDRWAGALRDLYEEIA